MHPRGMSFDRDFNLNGSQAGPVDRILPSV